MVEVIWDDIVQFISSNSGIFTFVQEFDSPLHGIQDGIRAQSVEISSSHVEWTLWDHILQIAILVQIKSEWDIQKRIN